MSLGGLARPDFVLPKSIQLLMILYSSLLYSLLTLTLMTYKKSAVLVDGTVTSAVH